MFKNSHLRLLLTLAGCRRLDQDEDETPDSTWIIPGSVSPDHLKDSLHFIQQAEFSPPTFDEHVLAENLLRRKAVARKKAAFDDDNDGDDDGGLGDEALFPMGGPTARKADSEEKPKKKLRRGRKRADSEEPDDAALAEKARKRKEREREKAAKIKSALYVNEGDDEFDSEEDEAFFAKERELAARAKKAAESIGPSEPLFTGQVQKKRKSEALLAESDEDEDEDRMVRRSSSDVNDASQTEDTPLDGSEVEGSQKRRRKSAESEDEDMGEADDTVPQEKPAAEEEEDGPVLVRRPRVRGGFVVESDDDE